MTQEELEKLARSEALRFELRRLIKSDWARTLECCLYLGISRRTLFRLKPKLRLGYHYRWRGRSKQMGLEWHLKNLEIWLKDVGGGRCN